jgi:hypothetical protein
MKWIKKGCIFSTDNNHSWMISHAQIPIVTEVDVNKLRIYFGTRDNKNRTTTTFIDVDANHPQDVLYVHDRQVLGLGKLGCFDDSGAMPSWIVNCASEIWLYYIGWNTGITVPYRNSIGLAISTDGGLSFKRVFEGPIMDRTHLEPQFVANPCILIEEGLWRMWYLATVKWKSHKGRSEPYYHIKYAESYDGINWERKGHVCIDFKSPMEGGISRPCVVKDGSLYRMWYSYRGKMDYRVKGDQSYRIGYAESYDGLTWKRMDEIAGIDVSDDGWDSDMIEYPYIFDIRGKRHMYYNGNGFGKSGFGYSELIDA